MDTVLALLERVEEVELERLEPSTTLFVWTRNSRYRLVLEKGSNVVLQGGSLFPEPTPAHIVGARAGGYLLEGRIGVGLAMWLRIGDRDFVTSPVVAIATDAPTTTALG